MDKNAIKKYAVWARRELIERVSQRAMIYGITADDAGDPNAESVNGHLLSQAEKRQRQALIRNIKAKGYEQVMEEVAYTWFNRFAALRFMEVNGYLPSHIRVFTNDAGEFKPQILAEAIHLDLDGLDMNKVYELESANKSEELFKYLLIIQCNALNSILPRMFQRIEDYTELLFPDYLLREGSVIEQMVTTIPEEDWTDQVQIIGWLYQYYNTDPKSAIDAKVKKGVKVAKHELPAKTQIFTPDWVVRYMSDNSLGRLWIEGHPDSNLKNSLKYYVGEKDGKNVVSEGIISSQRHYSTLKPEEIKCIDPCMGSGHILCVLFDTLVRIYEEYGYTSREAVSSIVENNLWGLDVDERAAQLAYFAVMMKARQYDRRFLSRGIQPHVYAIEESNGLRYDGDYGDFLLDKVQQETLGYLIDVFKDAKEYGSILDVEARDYDGFLKVWNLTEDNALNNLNMFGWYMIAGEKIYYLANQAKVLSQKYDVVITNPPYLGNGDMNTKLSELVQNEYAIAKSDTYSTFMLRCRKLLTKYGFQSMVTMQSWMNLGAFENLRKQVCETQDIITLWHLEDTLLGIAYQTCAFVLRGGHSAGFQGKYYLATKKDYSKYEEDMYRALIHPYYSEQDAYLALSGCPIAYSLGKKCIESYVKSDSMSSVMVTREGMTTGSNDDFLRLWFEVDINKMRSKWFPYNKGGEYRKWYGNDEYLVNWENDGLSIRNFKDEKTGRVRSHNYNGEFAFREGITWSAFSSRGATFRYSNNQFLFDSKGSKGFCSDYLIPYILAFLNSSVCEKYLAYFAGAKDKKPGHIVALPYRYSDSYYDGVVQMAHKCISIEKEEWDSREISWNFTNNQLLYKDGISRVEDAVNYVIERWKQRFDELKTCEERINAAFIAIFDVEGEIEEKVNTSDVTITIPDSSSLVRDLLSYTVGCMFGRYSLDVPSLVYAGGAWDDSKYTTFQPDKDAIIPICDDEYFEDDIVGRFVKFVEVAFGKGTLEENLRFIANSLGGKGSSREVIRNYFINDFYTDHLKMYQKRPIYWLFDSGKKNGFKCLIYMHRYQPDTIARIRTDYVHEQQSRYRTAIVDLEQRINGASTSERVKLSKQLATLQAQAEEIRVYEEKIHHLADQMIKIDLDDGVKHNYEIFKDVLAKIK